MHKKIRIHMNELNLQNDEFCKIATRIYKTGNRIVVSTTSHQFTGTMVSTTSHQFTGTIGPYILLQSYDFVVQEIQTWQLVVLQFYGTSSFVRFNGLTTFEEIRKNLNTYA
jgi:hypothetical protein